jgi:hypothetical protein
VQILLFDEIFLTIKSKILNSKEKKYYNFSLKDIVRGRLGLNGPNGRRDSSAQVKSLTVLSVYKNMLFNKTNKLFRAISV